MTQGLHSKGKQRLGGLWLDGPSLVEWIETRLGWSLKVNQRNGGSIHTYLGVGQIAPYRGTQTTQRRINSWKRGSNAEIYAVDRVLVDLGLHLSQVPDDLYRRPEDRDAA